VLRRLPDAIDKLSEIFLAVDILKPRPAPKKIENEVCQEPENDEIPLIM
jgi:hypothetical protein